MQAGFARPSPASADLEMVIKVEALAGEGVATTYNSARVNRLYNNIHHNKKQSKKLILKSNSVAQANKLD